MRPCPLAVVDGRPAVVCAYRKGETISVMFAHNSRADGSGDWAVAEAVTLADDAAATLGEIEGRPVIAYFQDDAVTLLRWYLAMEFLGDVDKFDLLWSFDVGPAAPGAHSGVVQVGEPAVLPALAFLDAQKGLLTFAVNQQGDGRGNWDLIAVEPQRGDIGTPSVAIVNGRPAIAYRDGAKGELKIALAGAADGRGAWKVTTVAPRSGQPRGQSLAVIDGRLAVAYEDEDRGLVFAYDPGFDNGDYWPAVVVDARPGLRSDLGAIPPSLALVAGRPAIAYTGMGGLQFAVAR